MATILDLLMALNRGDLPQLPAPAKPLPMIAPPIAGPDFQAFPEEPPRAPGAALDPNIIAQFAGQAPTPPPARQPAGLLEKIMLGLQGFGAGVQGQGPQFLAQLAEQRERPQREYQRSLERFEGRRMQGVEAATRAEERRREGQQRAAERAFEREYNARVKQLDLQSQTERDLFRDTLLAKRQREDDERQAERLQKQQEQQDKIKLATLASGYRKLGAKDNIATELARKDLDPNLKLSPGAANWESTRVRLDELRANRLAAGGTGRGGGGGASSKAVRLAEEIETVKDKMIEAEATTDNPTLKHQLRTKLNNLLRRAASFPELQVGLQDNKWPYVFVNGQPVRARGPAQQAAQPQAQSGQGDPLGIR